MLHGHGDNAYLFDRPVQADFSSNVWYGGEPAGLKEHLFRNWKKINRYPPVLAEELADRISIHHDLPKENILICNGAAESIYLVAQAFKGRSSCIVFPGFAEYEDACTIHDHTIRFLSFEQLSGDSPVHEDLFWIGNPNNPTGAIVSDLEKLIGHNPNTIFVIDEAFIEFTLATSSLIPALHNYPNLIILRSLTKLFAIPGLRLGYIAAGSALIRQLASIKIPWSVNVLAQEAGCYLFEHYGEFQIPLPELLAEKTRFSTALQQLSINIYPGHTHFFLCETPRDSAKELQTFLLEHEGLLIRNAANFRGLGDKHFRVATLSPDNNQLLINALKKWT